MERAPCECCRKQQVCFTAHLGSSISHTNRVTSVAMRAKWPSMITRLAQLVTVLLLLVSHSHSHPHVAFNTRLPAEFAEHYPHQHSSDPAFRVFYGTGVSLILAFGLDAVFLRFISLKLTKKKKRHIMQISDGKPPFDQPYSALRREGFEQLHDFFSLRLSMNT